MKTNPLPVMIQSFLLRELRTLRKELEAFPDDAAVWMTPEGMPNSAGTLALHLCGNLQHNIGALLGETGYQRNRELEFSARGLPRSHLYDEIGATEAAIRATMPRLTEAQLAEAFPEPIRNAQVASGEILIQLAVHLSYHLGQVNYHRRAVTGDLRGTGALDSGELSTAVRLPDG